ncbi:MAG: YheT family hydrolase [Cyclonatronaceae bacterium]
MPLIESSSYTPPAGFKNAHLQTIFPSLFRPVPPVNYRRERIETQDGDFLDIDRIIRKNEIPGSLAVISHGLEGSSSRVYVKGMAAAFAKAGYDVMAWNFRGCSGEMNRLPRFYHSGDTEDLARVVEHGRECGYRDIVLVGFSMGGNMSLKYAGEQGSRLPEEIRSIIAFSVPCDLATSARALSEAACGFYTKRFMRMLKAKIRAKAALMPQHISTDGLEQMRDFAEFDNAYTAPLHGFKNAEDYWHKASCKHVLGRIRRPALLINARNDPFLTPGCYPVEAARNHHYLFLEQPETGGHVGFLAFNSQNSYWSEQRAVEFAGRKR